MNANQIAAKARFENELKTVRNLTPQIEATTGVGIATVSNYVIADTSVILLVDAPNFPPVEIKHTGRFALPTIKSYPEVKGSDSLMAYPNGRTSFDAALFADSHNLKQNGGVRLRKAATVAPVSPANPIEEFNPDVEELNAAVEAEKQEQAETVSAS